MNFRSLLYFISFFFITSCATFKAQYATKKKNKETKSDKKIAHSFYLIGDAGNSELDSVSPALAYLDKHISSASENATLLFLGDNVYETGIPSKKDKKLLSKSC